MEPRARRAALGAAAGGPALDRLILDTTVLIAAERSLGTLDEVVHDEDDVAIAAVTAAELLVGVALAGEGGSAQRRSFVEDVLSRIPLLPYDLATARSHAELIAHCRRAGQIRGAHDLLIAATARTTRRVVVTADASGFADLPEVGTRILPTRA